MELNTIVNACQQAVAKGLAIKPGGYTRWKTKEDEQGIVYRLVACCPLTALALASGLELCQVRGCGDVLDFLTDRLGINEDDFGDDRVRLTVRGDNGIVYTGLSSGDGMVSTFRRKKD